MLYNYQVTLIQASEIDYKTTVTTKSCEIFTFHLFCVTLTKSAIIDFTPS